MKPRIVFASLIVLFLMTACVPFPVATAPRPTAVPAPVAQDGWQTYTNPLGFSIRYSAATWNQEELPQQAGETFQTVVVART